MSRLLKASGLEDEFEQPFGQRDDDSRRSRNTHPLGGILRGRDRGPSISERGSTREPSSTNRSRASSRTRDSDSYMPHEKTIKAATVWALAKHHDNTGIDSKAFSTLRTRDINKHMVDHVAMNDTAMNIDLYPVEYTLKDMEDEDFMVRNGPDGRGDHARLITTMANS